MRFPTARLGWRRMGAGMVAAMVLAGCGLGDDPLDEDSANGGNDEGGAGAEGDSASDAALTIGSADFPESSLLAEIYAEALRADGVEVDTQLGIG